MKRYLPAAVLIIIAILWGSSPAPAVNLIYEPFDYGAGQDLLGLRNTSAGTTAGTAVQADTTVGNLWLRAAPAASPAESIDIASGSLAGPSELKASIGNSLTIGDGTNSGATDRLAFRATVGTTDNITSGTIYYSFLLRVDDLTGANNVAGDYFASLNNTANNTTTVNPTVVPGQMRLRIDPNDPLKYSLGMFTQRALANPVTQADPGWVDGLTVGESLFVVGAFNLGATNSTQLWVNPDQSFFGQPGAPAATATDMVSGLNGGTIGSFLLHQRNPLPGLTMDELRVATTWGEVTPLGTPTYYWDIDANGGTAGAGGTTPSGTWDNAATNWNNGADGVGDKSPWESGATAIFSAGTDATGSYAVTLSGTQSASNVTFEDGSPTLTGGTLNLTGAHTIAASSGVSATIESVVSGSAGVVKTGAGTVILTANGTYSGDTLVSSGTLQVGNGGTSGSLPTGSLITANGTLAFNQSDNVTQGVEFSGSPVSGIGGLTQAGSGTLTLNAANTHSGLTRAAAGTLLLTNSLALQNSTLDLNGADSGAVSIHNSLTSATLGGITGSRNFSLTNSAAAALALTVGNGDSNAGPYSGQLSGAGSLTKVGTGVQTISGDNIDTGGTTINGGTLQYGQTVSMPASGSVTVNNGGALAVNAGGVGEWTNSTDDTTGGTIGSLIKGRGGRGTANQVTWMNGSTLGIDTTNSGGSMVYSGTIGGFRTTGGGTTNAVGFQKSGAGTLELSGANTFSGPLSIAANSGQLLLTGSNANAGSTMAVPTVGVGGNSTLRLGVTDAINSGSVINTQGPGARFELQTGQTQTIRSMFGNNGITLVESNATLTIADQAGDDYVFGNGGGTANVHTQVDAKIYKTGPGTLTLFGDAGDNFKGTFYLQNGTLKLSRNQAMGTIAAGGRLVVEDGSLGRSNTPTSNFTYSLSFMDLHVFRYDLSDAPAQTSAFNVETVTTLKEDDVEFMVTNAPNGTGRLNFNGDIRNHDPNPFSGDDPNAIRGITKTGNGVLFFLGTTTYKGSTTVEEGRMLVDADSTLGDYTQPVPGTLILKGGAVATTTTRTVPISNPVQVNGSGGISHISTAASASTVMEFNSDSIVGTSGSLTITNENTNNNTATVFRPTFTGSGFNFGLPIVISDSHNVGSGVKSNELQSGNTSGTQTFSGPISGGGSFRRISAGGTTILSGANTYSGGTTVDDGTLTASGASATLGTGNVTVNAGTLEILAGVANAIGNGATLSVLNAGQVALGAGINDIIASLSLDGNQFTTGTYGSSTSGAANTGLANPDDFFSGNGILTIVPFLAGDYNQNGVVDAADYVVWRKQYGNAQSLPNDDTPGVGDDDHVRWKAHFGNTSGPGIGSGLVAGVPEPGTMLLGMLAAMAVAACRRRRG